MAVIGRASIGGAGTETAGISHAKGLPMYLRLLRAAALAAALGWAGMPGEAQTQAPRGAKPNQDPVVARVDGTEIERSDLIAAQQALPEQYRNVPLQSIFQPLLRQMIDTLLVVGAARAQGLHNDSAVKRQMATMEGRILEKAYFSGLVDSRVTEQALRKDYQRSISGIGGEVKVRARHILVKTEAEALAVIDELIRNKADFAALARKKSTGPSSAKGGDLGFFAKGFMVKPFAEAAFAMKPGEITRKPVKTRFGWHVIKLVERRAGSVPSFEESRDKLSDEMSQRVIAEAVESLRADAKIETFGLDGAPPAPARIRRVQ